MNIYEKCKYFNNERMECGHPDTEGEPEPVDCIGEGCDCFELECPHCKKVIDCDDLEEGDSDV